MREAFTNRITMPDRSFVLTERKRETEIVLADIAMNLRIRRVELVQLTK